MSDFFKRIDSIFIGRKSYELTLKMGGSAPPGLPELKEYVFSDTLKEVNGNRVIVRGDIAKEVRKIKNEQGKDIWLFGGAVLTTSLINLGIVDEMSLAVHPVILGAGKPLFQDISGRINLKLTGNKEYSSGLVMLSYKFQNSN